MNLSLLPRLGHRQSKLWSILFSVTFTVTSLANVLPASSQTQSSDAFASVARPPESAMLHAAILAMPKAAHTLAEIQSAADLAGAKIEGKIGAGQLLVLVLSNKSIPIQSMASSTSDKAIITKLANSKMFYFVQQNFPLHINTNKLGGSFVPGYRINRQSGPSPVSSNSLPTDPLYPSQHYLRSLNIASLHSLGQPYHGQPAGVAVFDTGCNQSDLVLAGAYNALNGRSGNGNDDATGHGTALSVLIGAKSNHTGICGVAPNTPILSVKVADKLETNSSSTATIIDGINYCGSYLGTSGNPTAGSPIRIIVLGTEPLYMPTESPILHQYMKWFHDKKGGLIFQGEGRCFMLGSPLPYLIVVSGIDSSTYQAFTPIYYSPNINLWYCAPGTDLLTHNGREEVRENGTPYAAALCAGTAALLWSHFPMAKNSDLARILGKDGYHATPENQTSLIFFGACMPNAAAAYAGLINMPPTAPVSPPAAPDRPTPAIMPPTAPVSPPPAPASPTTARPIPAIMAPTAPRTISVPTPAVRITPTTPIAPIAPIAPTRTR